MNTSTIIYLIISVLSLILGITTNNPEQIQTSAKELAQNIERSKNDVQQSEKQETNATDIRP